MSVANTQTFVAKVPLKKSLSPHLKDFAGAPSKQTFKLEAPFVYVAYECAFLTA